MLARRLFRFTDFRGPQRDARSDLQRSETVWRAVSEALSSLEVERAGLGRRVEELRAWVGGLIGPEDGSACVRDRHVEDELVEAERQLLQGVQRLRELEALRAGYADLRGKIGTERERAARAYPAGP